MYEAKTRLSAIVEQVHAGTEVILMNRGEPVARIVQIDKKKKERKFGGLRGKIEFKREWDTPIEDFENYWR